MDKPKAGHSDTSSVISLMNLRLQTELDQPLKVVPTYYGFKKAVQQNIRVSWGGKTFQFS